MFCDADICQFDHLLARTIISSGGVPEFKLALTCLASDSKDFYWEVRDKTGTAIDSGNATISPLSTHRVSLGSYSTGRVLVLVGTNSEATGEINIGPRLLDRMK